MIQYTKMNIFVVYCKNRESAVKVKVKVLHLQTRHQSVHRDVQVMAFSSDIFLLNE